MTYAYTCKHRLVVTGWWAAAGRRGKLKQLFDPLHLARKPLHSAREPLHLTHEALKLVLEGTEAFLGSVVSGSHLFIFRHLHAADEIVRRQVVLAKAEPSLPFVAFPTNECIGIFWALISCRIQRGGGIGNVLGQSMQ